MRPSKTLSIAVTALSAAVIYLCSYIAIPLPFSPVPVTAHTLAIILVALILPRRESIGAILIYLLLGIATGGVTFGPAVGYYAGFILTAVLLPTFRGSEALILPLGDILRFFAEGKGVSCQTAGGVYAVRQRLYELEEELEGTRFVRVSHSEMVNLNKVTALDLSLTGTIKLTLEGDVAVYVSRRYVKKIKQVLGL